jgi:hypothetical protein
MKVLSQIYDFGKFFLRFFALESLEGMVLLPVLNTMVYQVLLVAP